MVFSWENGNNLKCLHCGCTSNFLTQRVGRDLGRGNCVVPRLSVLRPGDQRDGSEAVSSSLGLWIKCRFCTAG